jgi:hypothetical protein
MNKFLENVENVQRALVFESVQDSDKLCASVLYGELFFYTNIFWSSIVEVWKILVPHMTACP